MKNIFFGLFFGLVLSGCASNGVSNLDSRQVIEIDYGRVIDIEKITFDSHVGEAAIVGGVEGALYHIGEDSEDMIAGAIVGALFSSLFVSIEEGSRNGLIVKVETLDKGTYSVTTKNRKIRPNQCLRLIHGTEVSIKKVDTRYCKHLPNTMTVEAKG